MNLPPEFVKMYFLNAMPQNTRPNLVSCSFSLDEMAHLADNLLEYNYQNNPSYMPNMHYQNVSNVNRSNDYSRSSHFTHGSTDYKLSSSLSDFAATLIPIGVRAFNNKQRTKVCRFHLYNGNYAKKCKRWCFKNNSSINTLPESRPSSRSASPQRSHSEN